MEQSQQSLLDGLIIRIRGNTQLSYKVCVGVVYRSLPSQGVFFVLSGKGISGVSLTWDMTYLQVVPLHDVYPLPDPCIHASLVWKMTEWSVVRLNYHRVRPLTIVFPLGQSPHYAK